MKLDNTKEFPFSMDVAWSALHRPAELDIAPGAETTVISDTQWETHDPKSGATTMYTASFDETNHTLTIEGVSSAKTEHDIVTMMLTQVDKTNVALEIVMEINTGAHLIAKALGVLLAKPVQTIVYNHIYHNFEVLCTWAEIKRLPPEELPDMAGKTIGH